MDDTLEAFLSHHVATFNEAVRTGEFDPLVALFADDAELTFEGVPVGPFHGREAIDAAYAASPPTDTMIVLDTTVEEDGTIVEQFSWTADKGARSGEMRLTVENRQIRRLVVAFG